MDSRGLAPTGWHIPNDAEWTTLKVYVGSGAGAKLKSTSGMAAHTNYNGTNSTGFTALPGGRRAGGNGLFIFVGHMATGGLLHQQLIRTPIAIG